MLVTVLLLASNLTFIIISITLLLKLKKKEKHETIKADLTEAGILASGLAHEIRNPLNSIKINIQLLQEDIEESSISEEEKTEFKETVESITYEIGRLNELMTNFLTYARPVMLKKTTVNLNSFIENLVDFLSNQAQASNVTFNLNLPKTPIETEVDEQKLRQSFLNILINDIQILSGGGQIKISMKTVRDIVVIEITDNGPGMTENFMKEMFVAFSSQRKGGTGLGLSIAQKMIKAHGGGIKVKSELGKGTTFSIILPTAKKEKP
jgi:signal transduction histidine kinase